MIITTEDIKLIIAEEIAAVIAEKRLMLDPRITKSIEDRLVGDKEKAKSIEEPSAFDERDIFSTADELIRIDRKELGAPKNPRASGAAGGHYSDLPWEEYVKTAKAILLGHPKGWGYRSPGIEAYLSAHKT